MLTPTANRVVGCELIRQESKMKAIGKAIDVPIEASEGLSMYQSTKISHQRNTTHFDVTTKLLFLF